MTPFKILPMNITNEILKAKKRKQNRITNYIKIGWDTLSRDSQKTYNSHLKYFDKIINKDIQEITPDDILKYKQILKDNGLKNNSINSHLYALSKKFNLFIIQGVIKKNPITEINKIKRIIEPIQNQGIDILIKWHDVEKVLNKKVNREKQRATILIIKMLVNSALRISELINIKNINIKDFIDNNNILCKRILINGKGNKQREIDITTKLYNEIKEVFNYKSDYLFHVITSRRDRSDNRGNKLNRTNLYKQIRNIFEKQTGKFCRPHLLRHYWAKNMIVKEKMDLTAVANWLGHSDVNITAKYYIKSRITGSQAVLHE